MIKSTLLKKFIVYLFLLISWVSSTASFGANLIEVYQQALCSDPIFQQAIAQRLSTKQGVPITVAALLPSINGIFAPYLTRTGFSGSYFQIDANTGAPLSPRNTTTRGYTLALTIDQTIFNFAQFSAVAAQIAVSKGADATLNAALQDLMIRVSQAYFAILKDEDDLLYARATRRAFKEQLTQVRQQYEVGLKTVTEVYTAQASYDSAVANYIAIQNRLDNDKENLRVITGTYYPSLAKLSEDFPLVTPKPANIDSWVSIAEQQNWNVKAARYNVNASRQTVRQQFAGHLPTVAVQGTLDRLYADNINRYLSLTNRNGPGTQTDRSVGLNINIPFFQGGLVNAQTAQASYNFEISQQQLEQTLRNTINATRQSYLGIIASISQIKADRQTIKSTTSSLRGMEASFRVGTETLVNVLNQQEKVFQAQTEYARDRYNYVNYILTLKQSAGTLSFDDLGTINNWLVEPKKKLVKKSKKRKKRIEEC